MPQKSPSTLDVDLIVQRDIFAAVLYAYEGYYAPPDAMHTHVMNAMQPIPMYSQPLAMKPSLVDPLRSSVAHLLSRAHSLPCSAAAQSYMQLVPATSRFSLALDVLFPLLDAPVDVSTRCHS